MLVRSRLVSALKQRPYRTVSALSHLIATYIIPNPPAAQYVHVHIPYIAKLHQTRKLFHAGINVKQARYLLKIEGTMRNTLKCIIIADAFHFRTAHCRIGKTFTLPNVTCQGHVNQEYFTIANTF